MTRTIHLRGAVAAVMFFLTCVAGISAEPFPFDQELLLDAAPMRPGKRMPILMVEQNGNARIDLWCRTVPARIEISDTAIKIEPGPLPEGLPEMMSTGQCTPERIQADEEMLASLAQVISWRLEGGAVVMEGPKAFKFRASDH